MAIYRLLQFSAFAPEDITEDALRVLNLADRQDPITDAAFGTKNPPHHYDIVRRWLGQKTLATAYNLVRRQLLPVGGNPTSPQSFENRGNRSGAKAVAAFERHRRLSGVLGLHSITSSAAGESERMRRLEVDHHLELRRLKDRHFCRIRALQNLSNVFPSLAVFVGLLSADAHGASVVLWERVE